MKNKLTTEESSPLLATLKQRFEKNKQQEAQQAVARIAIIAHIIETTTRVNIIKEDPDDNKIIECAIDAKADYIISSDKHIHNHKKEIRQQHNIHILTPQEFLQIFTSQQQGWT